ncbi:MAG: GNAT family N-acetyltransferase [Ruminiclostridium sp.]|nr:GNAT family N-acetyltransferase [Ruminiclostridium sp.]
MITYRKAKPEDIYPAFELALRVFIEFEAPDYEQDAVGNFKSDCIDNEQYINNYVIGKHLMHVALEDNKIVGFVNERGNGHISMLFVDGLHQRQGIATTLMNNMVCELKLHGFDKITLNSSPYGLPFYKHFGFKPTDTEQKKDGFIFTPMEYIPNDILDILDEKGNKTGRYAERGRKIKTGDYFLIVHVWKHNNKGEWLIDQRTPRYGNGDLDGKWETTGGCAVAGDESLSAALRETREELGIELDPSKGMLFKRTPRLGDNGHTWFEDVWVFDYNEPIESVAYDGSEVCDAMWATTDKIREMMTTGEFVSAWLYPYFDEMVEKCEVAK